MSSSSSSSIPPRDSRPYDVVLYGATGFTGGLVAHYLAGSITKTAEGLSHRRVNKPLPDGTPRPPLKWAIAGRDQKKLDAIKRELDIDERVSCVPDIIIADAKHAESLRKMTASTRVVLSTVGPFLLHGTPLVAACVETGTDYCDTTGEAVWVDRMIRQYGEQAERNGAILSSMCGFDSVPSDLGCFMVARELAQTYNTRLVHAQGFTSVKGGGASGGTIATIINGLSLPAEDRKRQGNKYILNPPGTAPARTRTLEKDQLLPRFDTTIQRWTAPWLMALVNTRVVRRSIGLRRQLDPKNGGGYGEEASYNECMPASGLLQAIMIWLGLVLSMLVLVFKPTRVLAQKFVLPAPGEGPSRESRERTTFAHRVVGEGENGQKVISTIGGGDPGYGDTARMVSEVALILAQDRDTLELNKLVEKRGRNGLVGGFFTPSVVGGQLLVERLRKAGMTLKVHEFKDTRVGGNGSRRLAQPAPGRVVAVHKDAAHHFSKPPVDEITLVKALGVEGDAHAGATVQHRSRVAIDPTQANLRQVHLIREELFDEVAKESQGRYQLKAGQLGENITTHGLDLHRFPVGTILHLGTDGAQVQLTGTRTPCPQIDEKAQVENASPSDPLTKYLHEKDADGGVRVKGGVMTIVRAGGRVRPGDEIRVELPKGEHRPLPRV